MVFNSFEFIFMFLPIVLVSYVLASRVNSAAGTVILAISSAIFYGALDGRYLPILILSIVINYLISVKIENSLSKKFWLIAGLIFDFGLLAYYKLIDVLPLGISFWTFAQVGYLVEVYRTNIKPLRLLSYINEILFFPVITSGPIISFTSGGGG